MSDIIFIGHQGPKERFAAVDHLLRLGLEDLAFRVGHMVGVEEFDMATKPEKGDALDHIKQGLALVVAFNLYGVGLRERPDPYAPKTGYFYNRRNHELLLLCQQHEVPLLCLGDQPKGMCGIQLYTPLGR